MCASFMETVFQAHTQVRPYLWIYHAPKTHTKR